MAFCANCGKEISDEAVVCPYCGVPTKSSGLNKPDDGGFLWGLLGFCIPIVGLILYLVWKDERPITAKAVGVGALISVGFTVMVYLIIFLMTLGSM
jgi:hypothetical protein